MTVSRNSKLLERLDAGARHQDYPEAFHLSWTSLAADAANEIRRLTAALSDQAGGWLDISTAPKDRTSVLVVLKNPLPNVRDDLRKWDGLQFVARHSGLADDGFDIGWNFAAPVGHGGFPDDWIAGWQPLPAPPPSSTAGEE